MKNPLAAFRYLIALHEHRHFGRAAVACHITQPALSNSIRSLEDEFGVVIVNRGRAFAGFTPEGERLLRSALLITREHDIVSDDLRSLVGSPQGVVRIGVVPTAVPIAARFVALLNARHPRVRTVTLSLSSSQIEEGLDTLALDLALGYTERVGRSALKLEAIPAYDEDYYLLERNSIEAPGLTIGPAIRWRDAAGKRLCMLTTSMHHREIID